MIDIILGIIIAIYITLIGVALFRDWLPRPLTLRDSFATALWPIVLPLMTLYGLVQWRRRARARARRIPRAIVHGGSDD